MDARDHVYALTYNSAIARGRHEAEAESLAAVMADLVGKDLTVSSTMPLLDDLSEPVTKAFNPNQPRKPAGSPEGGRWTGFHGTSTAAWESIKSDGLVPGKGGGADDWLIDFVANYPKEEGEESMMDFVAAAVGKKNASIKGRDASVYFSMDLEEAKDYALKAAEVSASEPVLLRVRVPNSDKRLHTDEASGSGVYRYQGTIPAKYIDLVEIGQSGMFKQQEKGLVTFYAVVVMAADDAEKAYNPNQPREPKGRPEGGRYFISESKEDARSYARSKQGVPIVLTVDFPNDADILPDDGPVAGNFRYRGRVPAAWIVGAEQLKDDGEWEEIPIPHRQPGEPGGFFLKGTTRLYVVLEDILDKYDPNQPREPKGSAIGGRWTSSGGVRDSHPLSRDNGTWGSSHSNSRAIAGRAASLMGIGGYQDVSSRTDGHITDHAINFLEAIYKSPGTNEPLYHGFDNRANIDWKPGDVFKLPLVATSGSLQDSAGYGIWNTGDDARPTVFEFPKGTRIAGYSRWDAEDTREFGHQWAEALTAGEFKVVSRRSHKFDHTVYDVPGGRRPEITVIRLEPIAWWDQVNQKWEADNG